ncbi:co-chaperone protein daf-41-like [Argonauta hians]
MQHRLFRTWYHISERKMANNPTIPPVSWAQRKDRLFVTIHVEDCDSPDIKIEDAVLHFKGAGGPEKKIFAVDIPFFEDVIPQDFKKNLGGRELHCVIKKRDECWWPRLVKGTGKMHYLKTDFARWKDQDDSETEEPDEFNLKEMMNKMGSDEYGEDSDENSDDDGLPDLE